MRTTVRYLIVLTCLAAARPAARAEEPDHEIHQELRTLLTRIETAINTGKYDEMATCFTEKVRATTINQEVILSREGVAPYFRKWFGPGGYLKSLHMTLTADALTELNAEKTFGIVRGSGQEDYTLADGRFFPMKTRWTATVVKDTDGAWRILAIHIGTNFLDNPILAKAEKALGFMAGAGFAAGVVLTSIVAFFLSRRRRAA